MGLRDQLTYKPMRYYIYMYIDPVSLEPFYVGKGKNSRWRLYKHENISNLGLRRKIAKARRTSHEVIIDIVIDELDESAAFIYERALIAVIGRRDLGTGPLFNLTNGGEGTTGPRLNFIPWNKGKTLSPEHLQKISDTLKGRIFSEEHRRKISESGCKNPGKRGSVEWIRKQRESHLGQPAWNKGKKHSKETRQKISEALKKRNKND